MCYIDDHWSKSILPLLLAILFLVILNLVMFYVSPGLEKAFKDLQRQSNSLERLRHLLDHEIDRSFKSVKSVFEELRKG